MDFGHLPHDAILIILTFLTLTPIQALSLTSHFFRLISLQFQDYVQGQNIARITTVAPLKSWKYLHFTIDLLTMVRNNGWDEVCTFLEGDNVGEVKVQHGFPQKFRLSMISMVRKVTLQRSQVGFIGGVKPESVGHLSSLTNVHTLVLRGVTGLARGGLDAIAALQSLREVTLEKCPGELNASCLANCWKVCVSGCSGFGDVSSLGNVKELTLRNNAARILGLNQLGGESQEHLDIAGCRNIYNVRHLSALKTLLLDETNITDVTSLGDIEKLTLQRCQRLRDVSALSGVTHLSLTRCKNISDVSALAGVKTLDLQACNGIVDVSALGKIHTLDLSYCSNLSDVSALGEVHTLDLSGCHRISDVSLLGNVTNLSLRHCRGIRDFTALRSVRNLDLMGCNVLTSENEDGGEASSSGM
jgi:Leucine-rich repeat (LRR) protein